MELIVCIIVLGVLASIFKLFNIMLGTFEVTVFENTVQYNIIVCKIYVYLTRRPGLAAAHIDYAVVDLGDPKCS